VARQHNDTTSGPVSDPEHMSVLPFDVLLASSFHIFQFVAVKIPLKLSGAQSNSQQFESICNVLEGRVLVNSKRNCENGRIGFRANVDQRDPGWVEKVQFNPAGTLF
jgi:hypothetical protein